MRTSRDLRMWSQQQSRAIIGCNLAVPCCGLERLELYSGQGMPCVASMRAGLGRMRFWARREGVASSWVLRPPATMADSLRCRAVGGREGFAVLRRSPDPEAS